MKDFMASVFSSCKNYYKILDIPEDAPFYKIKEARNKLATRFHPDKAGENYTEIMQKINEAFKTLSDPKKRAIYDNKKYDDILDNPDDVKNPSNSVSSGYLDAGFKLSDVFKKKIALWTADGPPDTDATAFKDPSVTEKNASTHTSPPEHSPDFFYKKLLKEPLSPINDLLAKIIPHDIFNWSEIKNDLKISKYIVNSPLWNGDLPSKKPVIHSKVSLADYQKKRKEAEKVLSFLDDGESAPIMPWNTGVAIYCLKEHSKGNSPGLFAANHRREIGSVVPLCSPSLAVTYGYIPKHVVRENNVGLDTEASCCSDCSKSFGLFRWRSNCMMCGNANCSDCLVYGNLPDYVDSVEVCKSCMPQLPTFYSTEWTAPLDDSNVRKVVTAAYLSVIKDLGIASNEKFLGWVDKFIADGRNDLAMLSNFLGNGDWMALALKFAKNEGNYRDAVICLGQVNKTSHDWEKLGDTFARTELTFAMKCYQKAGFDHHDFVKKALQFPEDLIGKCCMLILLKMTLKRGQKSIRMVDIIDRAIAEKKYDLAVFCNTLENISQKEWIDMANTIDIEAAEPFLEYINVAFRCDWKSIKLTADRDHLRWRFLGTPQFATWLNYLVILLQKCDGKNCIPYFRSVMCQENFVAHRDKFIGQGDYTKALICHRLIPNSISWAELAQKWRNKSEGFSLASLSCCPETLETLADGLFEEKHFSLALHCYLNAGNFDKILKNAKKSEYPMRLLYQMAIFKYTTFSKDVIVDVCQTLLLDKANAPAVKKIMVAALKNLKGPESLPYHKVLAESAISNKELLGLLQMTAGFCKEPSDKKWHATLLKKCLESFEKELRFAICTNALNLPLLDQINPMTLDSVKKILEEFKVDTLVRGPMKSACLVVRAIGHLVDSNSASPGAFGAMNDISEAMLGDSREAFIEFCCEVVEKIQRESSWKLRNSAMTALQFPSESEFKKCLQSNPQLRMIIQAEKAIGKFIPIDAAMSYIDLSMGISGAPGLAGSFLTAALHLVKALEASAGPLWRKERYAHRRAIVELVAMACTVADSHLCPTTKLYIVRSSIAILTAAFQHQSKISAMEHSLLEDLYSEVDELSQLVPLAMGKMLQVYDLLYLDLINREFLEKYLPRHRDAADSGNKDPRYQYFILDGAWKGWLSQEAFPFELERQRTMRALLEEKGNSMDDVEALMNWPGVVRDSNGWLPKEVTPLNLSDEKYSRVEGIRFDLDSGDVFLLLETSTNPMEALFDMGDVVDIMKMGVTGAWFTLDPPDGKLPYHPFQEMRYMPERLSGTPFLGTMYEADYRLKALSMRQEVSCKAPFEMRNAEDHLLQRLPQELQEKFCAVWKKAPKSSGKVHRFWIEAGKLPYYEAKSLSGREITYTLGDCRMSVKKHLMQRDRNGSLVDAEVDDDRESPEAKFAALMTEEYDNLGKFFPEFLRLRELVKLQALAVFAQSIDKHIQETAQEHGISKDLLNICKTFKKMGIATEHKTTAVKDRCCWVPAAFRKDDHSRVYGGVSMNLNLVPGGSPPPPPQTGGPVGPGASGTGFRHIVGVDQNGRIYGTSVCVDSVSGLTFRLDLRSDAIRDQWNQNYTGEITAFWKARFGYSRNERSTTTEHYTSHTNGSYHLHNTSGMATCVNAEGHTATFKSHDKTHKCSENKGS